MQEYLQICKEGGVGAVVELKWTAGVNSNDVSGLDVDIDTVLHAPVEMVGPVLAGQELESDVGIVLSDIFQTGLHRSEDNPNLIPRVPAS